MNATPAPDFVDPIRRAAVRDLLHRTIQEAGRVGSPSRAPRSRRHRVMRFAAITAAAVLVVGGGGLAYATLHGGPGTPPVAVAPPATSAPAPSSPSSSNPEPTPPGGIVDPAGTASPAPVLDYDPADPSTWKVTTAGVGPIDIGSSQKASAMAASTAYTVTAPGYACPVDVYTPKSSASPRLTTQASNGDRIDFVMIGTLGTTPAAKSPKTPSGIGLGSTRAQLLATYPHIESLSTSVGTTSTFGVEYGIQDSSGRWLTFTFDEHARVAEIGVSFTRGIPGEFC